jgi:uncharacterized protein (TIGR02118 family)
LACEEGGVIKVSVFYANGEGKHFDIAYYCEKHMPLVQRLCGQALQSMAVEHGLSGMAPGSPAPFLAMGHLYFETVDTFQAAFGPHLNEIISDVPNYTNIEPRIQISEVKM